MHIKRAWPVGHETSIFHKLLEPRHRRHAAACGKNCDPCSVCERIGARHDDERADAATRCGAKCTVEIRAGTLHWQRLKLDAQCARRGLHRSQMGCLARVVNIPEDGHPGELSTPIRNYDDVFMPPPARVDDRVWRAAR